MPDHVHEELQRRAAAAGTSLRHYPVKVLDEHVAVPTMDEWLVRMARRRAFWLVEDRNVVVDAAEAVRQARYEDDEGLSEASG